MVLLLGLTLCCCKGNWTLFKHPFPSRCLQTYGRAPDTEHSLKTQELFLGPLTASFKSKRTAAIIIYPNLNRNGFSLLPSLKKGHADLHI